MQRQSRLRGLMDALKRLLRKEPEPPEDPYAYVGAPKKPRPPQRRRGRAARIIRPPVIRPASSFFVCFSISVHQRSSAANSTDPQWIPRRGGNRTERVIQ